MNILVMYVDGAVDSVEANSTQEAISKLFKESYVDSYEEFLDEISLIETPNNGKFDVLNYKTNVVQVFTSSRLKNYLKIKPTNPPRKELEEEYDNVI